MPHIAGRRSYARETYPEPRRSGDCDCPTGPTGPEGAVGGGSFLTSDVFIASSEEDINTYTLSQTPVSEAGIIFVANGTIYGPDFWNLVGNVITWTSTDPSLVEGWQIIVFYQPVV